MGRCLSGTHRIVVRTVLVLLVAAAGSGARADDVPTPTTTPTPGAEAASREGGAEPASTAAEIVNSPELSDEEVTEAARLAYADHFIVHLPQQYQTRLSESGSNLSHSIFHGCAFGFVTQTLVSST